ncbi:MAG: tryptophan--tRNA ligase [Salinivirgaceae bacterium]|jgi:tryptophanyl-tRNA synthetase|nr:tryptophan--tRNA ligase [Salinivirgaceae bacterium]
MERVVSGIRSTGNLHLGNYFGAIRNFVRMQNDHECFFFIADYHSLTTHPTPNDLHSNVRQVLVEYLAAGIDPEKATLFVQSDVPEVAELTLLLSMNAYVGELERTSSFKEKVRKNPNNVNAGLLTYPVLMAADILIHRATKVPVGKDQEQHLEMCRKYARRFNGLYKTEYFKEPEPFNFGQDLLKIPGLDGTGKMGKSEGNGLFLADSPKQIRKKVMKAVTDSGPTEPNSPVTEPVQNLFTIMDVVSEPGTLQFFQQEYANCTIRYGDLKKQLAEDIVQFVEPIYNRIQELSADSDYLQKIARMGAEKAHESAAKTVKEVREIIGFKKF